METDSSVHVPISDSGSGNTHFSNQCPSSSYSWQFVIVFALSIAGRLAGQYIMKDKPAK